ncbi:hypothetical protein KUTeg_003312 [Tegillarca granosa]|uniref:methionine adenosyltransferase n=1 Tax=Tegillarca granosa TaxID=220873 RepID=A0ABQ9FQ03_TEGGR|nr:hypothetical protein KUTeg_003312 [Tegillarca granosa]
MASANSNIDIAVDEPGTFLFSSESVGEGHPDKICDQVSDAILDAHLKQDPYAKVACESVSKTGMIMGDAGLTGRKIIVDTYGGWGAHGGGAFSGKDFSKVDRSAAYAARWVAKSLVKAGLCRRVLVQVAYAIGVSEPLSITVFHYGTSKKTEKELLEIVKSNFDLRPGKIVK